MKLSSLILLMQRAFEAGFDASGEGFNGEHMKQGAHVRFERLRDEAMGNLIAAAIKDGTLE